MTTRTTPPTRLTRWIRVAILMAAPVVLAVAALTTFRVVPAAQAHPTRDTTIQITDSGFVPQAITVSAGSLVVWENDSDSASHRVAFNDGPTSPVLQPRDAYQRTFDTAGDYPYHCAIHPSETAVVHVVGHVPPSEPAELSVTSSRDQPVTPGAAIDYHITYENRSDATVAQNTVLTVTLPSGAVLLSSQRRGVPLPPTSQVGQDLVYALGAVPADSENQIDLRVQMPSPLPATGDVTLTARISASNVDSRGDHYTEDSSQVAVPRLTLGVRPAEDSGPFVAGGVVTYTLEYANRADDVAAPNVTVTLQLPAVATFVSATRDDETGQTTVNSSVAGNIVSFFLGTLAADSSGRIYARVRLSDSLAAGQPISITARINGAVAGVVGGEPERDSESSDSQIAPGQGPNMYVRLSSSGDNEISGRRVYQVAYGNIGVGDVASARVTLTLPSSVSGPDFGATPPTFFNNNTAVWQIPLLDGQTAAIPFYVRVTLRDSGNITATATITGTSEAPDIQPADNEAVDVEPILPLARPTVYTPKTTIVGPRPTFRGLGTPGATLSVFLAASASGPTQKLGSAVVRADRTWTITPTTAIAVNGWHWVTATQTLNNHVSGVAGASFAVTSTTAIDPDSLTRNGIPLGGLNPTLGWAPNHVYKLGMKLPACATPISPTLQSSLFNAAGLMTGYKRFPGVRPAADPQHVDFDFTTPISTLGFELYVDYDCPAATPAGPVVHIHTCIDGPSCSDDPPAPPHDCEDCVPGKPPRPRAIDPDGFVYDAAAVRAGATITQSIITRAWVTATRQTAPGAFAPWNALEYGQVNPQYTDSAYPDKVLTPGYFSFRVPPGAYRLNVATPGFLPYDSPVLQVIETPITHNVPLERSGGVQRNVATVPPIRIFLPYVRRQ